MTEKEFNNIEKDAKERMKIIKQDYHYDLSPGLFAKLFSEQYPKTAQARVELSKKMGGFAGYGACKIYVLHDVMNPPKNYPY